MLHTNKGSQFLLLICLLYITLFAHAKLPVSVGLNQPLVSCELPDGLSANDWNNIQTQVKAGKYKAYADDNGGFNSTNPAHGWQIHYAMDGTTTLTPRDPESTHYHLGMRLTGIGYQTTKQALTALQHPQQISHQDNSLDYHWTDSVTERWINSETDLEQWFLLKQRPPGAASGQPLTLQLTLNSDLSSHQQGNSLNFTNTSGTLISYSKLKVWDATGRLVPAQMHLQGLQLNLIVDDSVAYYPLTIDPSFQQQAYLKASSTDANDQFGSSVAIAGDTLVVGASFDDSNASDINGDQTNNSANDSGAVYVFTRSNNSWSQQAYLKASNTEPGDSFGTSVAIAGDTVVVGASNEDSGIIGDQADNSADQSGAVYVFTRSSNTWSQQAYLKASNAELGDQFGFSVAIANNTVVVGASSEDSSDSVINGDQTDNLADQSGAVYVFTRSNNTWSQQAYLKASNTGPGDAFGNSLAINGNTVVVGALFEDNNASGINNGDQTDNSAIDSGAAYVFTRINSSWSQQAYLKASNTGLEDSFGTSVAIAGNTVVVGASNEDSGISDDQADNSADQSGAVYVFTRSNSTWSQQAYLKASNAETGDQFGISVAIVDNTLVAGASNEASNASDINGDQTDNSADASGAAYVFTRSNSTWNQQDYLKASNTEPGDSFGKSVAISGDTVVVGALLEDSNANGIINGDQTDNSASDSGAVYLLRLNATVGGSLSGLATASSMVLQNNNGDNITLIDNGEFTFPTALFNGSNYDASIFTQPTNPIQTCTISNGSGTLANTDVTTVNVYCSNNTYSVGGMLLGLAPDNSVVLQNNAGDDITVSSDGVFIFSTALADGSNYDVTVLTQPTSPNQTCSVTNGTGTLASTDFTTVNVNCSNNTHTVGGSVTGLAPDNSVILQNNAGDDITVSSDGVFIFSTALADGSDYAVTVLTQPTSPNQTCSVTNGNGTLASTDFTTVNVNCSNNTHSVGGSVTGLAPDNSAALQNNAGDDITVSSDGTFTFSTALADGSDYTVTVLTQPTSPNQTCSVTNGNGTLANADIDNVTVTCTTNQSSSLIGSWTFDDGSGTTAIDTSGNDNHGTVNGATWVNGFLSGALGFNGVDDYVDLGTVDIPGNQLTIAAWINADTYTHLRLRDARIVSKTTGTAEQAHLWMLSTIKSGDNTRLRFRLKTNNTTTTLIGSANSLPVNTWIHVAAVYDGSEMRLYQNGVEVASISKTGTINQNIGISAWIGQNPVGNKPFAGLIDDVQIHNQSLSATEIMDLANEGSTNNQAPIAIATATPNVGLAALDVTFNSAGSSDPENGTLTFQWDFGDSSLVSNAANPTHTYTTAGTYSATLTVTDDQEQNATDTVSITVNDSVIPAPDLLGYWALDEGTGETALDSSGNNNQGTINGATWNNGVLKFDGINDYVNLGKLDVPGQALTLTGWVQSDDLENCRFLDCRIISKSTGTSAQAHYWMLSTIKVGNQIRLRFRLKANGTTSTLIASSGDLTNGEMFHAAAVYDGATMRLYKNGVEVGSLAKTGSINTRNTVEAWIGSNPNIPTSRPWKGSIADVRVYQKALTAAELNIVIEDGEVSDSTAPIISNIQTTVTNTTAIITWETNEAADSVIAYGLDNNYGSNASDPALTTTHSITLAGLAADTEYHYAVSSIDASGNVANGIDQTFITTTTTNPDTTPPIINNIQATVTDTTTTITWETDEAADSQVSYGTSIIYENGAINDGDLVLSHILALTGLTPDTTYHYQVESTDASGNNVSSTDLTFTTDATNPGTGGDLVAHWPLTEISGTTASDISGSGNDAVLTNDPAWNGNGLMFDGNNDYVNAGVLDVSGQTLTLAGWVQSDNLGNCPFFDCRIISKSIGTSTQAHYWMLSTIKVGSATRLRFRLKINGSTTTLIASQGDLTNGEQFHVAAVYDGISMLLYKNGIEVGRVSKTGNIDTNSALEVWIGGNPTAATARPWDGLIADVRIYQKALTKDEVINLINEFDTSDTTAPVLSNIQATVTDTSATITWDTNEASDSLVDYGLTDTRGTTANDTELTTAHRITFTGLTANTEYYYQVSSTDNNGNTIVSDTVLTITTASIPDPSAIQPKDAAHFLTQSTFGPNANAIQHLVEVGSYESWLDEQFNLTPSYHRPLIKTSTNSGPSGRMNVWWDVAVLNDDQLRQRVAFAFSEIMVVSDLHGVLSIPRDTVAEYYDVLVRHSFGNFRDLLEDITLNPAMGIYLSMLGNDKPDPSNNRRADENYAREILQLFSIGLVELSNDGTEKSGSDGKPIDTYSQSDVENLARIFTGWAWGDPNNYIRNDRAGQNNAGLTIKPMIAFSEHHDQNEKSFLGITFPAGQTAQEDLKQALDTIFNHPNVGPFIGKQLIMRLVTSNPSPEYVSRVAQAFNNNGAGIRGDLQAVVKTILLDPEARTSTENHFGKLKEPLIRLTHLWRAFNATRRLMNNYEAFHYAQPEKELSQAPMRAPSVFNFFRPDFSPHGEIKSQGLVAPEFQIISESRLQKADDAFIRFTVKGGFDVSNPINLDLTNELALLDEPDKLIEHLDLLLTTGSMSNELRQILLSYINSNQLEINDDRQLIQNLIALIISSAEYSIQR